jgi:hypothetical protein
MSTLTHYLTDIRRIHSLGAVPGIKVESTEKAISPGSFLATPSSR